MNESKVATVDAALSELPIFPLPQVVFFPRATLPLHIFEPRYRAMLKDCLGTHKAMAIALIVNANERDANGNPRIAEVAGAGIIVEHHALADGRSNILMHGTARVRLEELPFVPPYRRARATILNELRSRIAPEERTALVAATNAFANDVRKRDPDFSFPVPPNLEPGAIADLAAHHLIIDAYARQRILEELDPVERVRAVTAELVGQHAALAGGRGAGVN